MVNFNGYNFCADGSKCEIQTVEGKPVCRHGLCEFTYLSFLNNVQYAKCCPLDLQQLEEKKQWNLFYRNLGKTKRLVMKHFNKYPFNQDKLRCPSANNCNFYHTTDDYCFDEDNDRYGCFSKKATSPVSAKLSDHGEDKHE